ncbi:O-methyltransferase-domain-containing protein [Aspergillus similis]
MPSQPPQPTRIAALADSITRNTAKINEYYQANNLPSLSFDPLDTRPDLHLPAEIQHSQTAVLDATAELNDLITGPRGLISNAGYIPLVKFAMSRFIHRFNLVQKVPSSGEISYDDLATSVGINASTLRQLLRAAMTFHLFQERRLGYVSHSSVTKLLLDDPVLHDCTGFTTEDLIPAFLGVTDALVMYPAADDPSKSGYMVAHNASEPSFYLHLAKDPEKIRRFANCMSQATAGPQWSLHYLTDYFPWESLGPGTVVDVGGAGGQAALAIARKAPRLHLIVQDMADAIAAAKEEPGVNVSYMVADFFAEQTVKGADVYLFRSVMHNWPDSQAVRILRAQIPALKAGAKVLVMDEVMPDAGAMGLSTARTQRLMDLSMLALGNSRVRDAEGWRELFRQADGRFVVEKITTPEGSHLALIDVTWKP